MISILITANQQKPIRNFLTDWSQGLRTQFEVVTYEGFALGKESISGGTVIFADLERLSHNGLKLAKSLAEKLQEQGRKIFNDPALVLTRFALLKKLHQLGINDFDVYTVGSKPKRWPVFLRWQCDHGMKLNLIHDEEKLESEYDRLLTKFGEVEDLMLIEYVDVCVDGLYRSYSVVRIGDHFIPRHAHVNTDWVVRQSSPEYATLRNAGQKEYDETLAAEHMPVIKKCFEIAQIEYGRVDYGIVNGKIQIFEINTHPNLVNLKVKITPDQMERSTRVTDLICKAFNELAPANQEPVKPLLEFKPTVLRDEVHLSKI